MVFLDVVYNHFGPEGNYLHRYAPAFFTERHRTPWGAAINFDDVGSRMVRDFFIHNALYWLEEYHLDGLRLDAVHAIADDSEPDILEELVAAVREGPGRDRHVHLVIENADNAAHYLARRHRAYYDAQWNDDLHHALHVLITGEHDGYYADYVDRPLWHLGRCLAEGFAYQGEPSAYRGHRRRGEPSFGVPPTAFVSFLQNHDQVGNRAFGERLATLVPPKALRAAVAIVLLAPSPPLLFMGEEFGAANPFLYFCDFAPELGAKVREGRRGEFARFEAFRSAEARARIPDPNAVRTFERSRLDWGLLERPAHRDWLELYRALLRLRAREITPRLSGIQGGGARFELLGNEALEVRWRLGDGSRLTLLCNLGKRPLTGVKPREGEVIYSTHGAPALREGRFPPWSVVWALARAG
jgi:malto-oligosyltrehalose trehalohydrolase